MDGHILWMGRWFLIFFCLSVSHICWTEYFCESFLGAACVYMSCLVSLSHSLSLVFAFTLAPCVRNGNDMILAEQRSDSVANIRSASKMMERRRPDNSVVGRRVGESVSRHTANDEEDPAGAHWRPWMYAHPLSAPSPSGARVGGWTKHRDSFPRWGEPMKCHLRRTKPICRQWGEVQLKDSR